MHDPELPAGLQDADFEMAGLVGTARLTARLRKRGICTHGWLTCPPGKPAKCNDCGQVFPSEAAAHEARREILDEYL